MFVNGRPFFPIGSYYVPRSENAYSELAEAGFNLIQCAPSKRELDMANDAGLMAWVVAAGDLDFSSDAEKHQENLRNLVMKFKDHPALLAWESRDEPAWTWKRPSEPAVPRKGLVAGHRFLRHIDPNHPIWVNHAPRNLARTLIGFSEGAQIISCDIYPVIPCGLKEMYAIENGFHGDLLNQTASSVGEYTRKMRRVAGKDRSVWMVLQAFAWEGLREPKDRDSAKIVFPTYSQLRFMAYDAIINGANGILFWGTEFVPCHSNLWDDLERVTKEISNISPVLLSTSLKNPLSVGYVELGYSMDNAVEMIVKRYNRKTYIITANRSPYPVKVTFSGAERLFAEREIVVWGEGRKIKLLKGKFTDEFQGFGVHVYTNAMLHD